STTDQVLIPNGPCTDTVRLHLTIGQSVTSEFSANACNSYALPWGTVVNTSGDYTHLYQTTLGCDSTVTAHITIGTGGHTDTTVTACGSFTWNRNGQTYLGSTTDQVLIPNGLCTDTVILHLTIGQPMTSEFTDSACNSYVLPWGTVATTSGDYSHLYQTTLGCDSTVTAHITIGTVPPNLVVTDPAQVCSPATVDLTNPAITAGSDPGLVYTYWTDAGDTIPVPDPTAVSLSGTYYIKATSAGGCSSTKSVLVHVKIAKAILGIRYPDVSTSSNTPVQLNARDLGVNYSYSWQPPIGLNFIDIKNPTFNYNQPTQYTVTLTPPDGSCPTTDTVLVNIADNGSLKSALNVPNAWSPNGDGHNDKLYPLTINMKELKYFRVYNRWGQLMFETHTLGQGWDGIFNGVPQVMDVYTWIVEADGLDGVHYKLAGNSILMR
ncbi:MAG: gliding motility-associated C-terminal domain-containing protein, partial [Chitinophagales bacterium]